jgi:hypothetical protein
VGDEQVPQIVEAADIGGAQPEAPAYSFQLAEGQCFDQGYCACRLVMCRSFAANSLGSNSYATATTFS